MASQQGRLSGLDSSFLTVEGANAHMHVGWAALFGWPRAGSPPTFEHVRDHVAARLDRYPRCRQRVVGVPLGIDAPVWADDVDFDIDHHVRRLPGRDFRAAVDEVLSQPLDRGRPLWELWIADELEGGRIGILGKAHHAMVDGIAAIELAMLLVDVDEQPATAPAPQWSPQPEPSSTDLLAGVAGRQASQALELARASVGAGRGLAGLALSPGRAPEAAAGAASGVLSGMRALGHALLPAPEISLFAGTPSPRRSLAGARRPLSDLQSVRRALGGTVNDIVLAAVAGGLRRFALRAGAEPGRPKVMVPVNVRGNEDPAEMGNRISFVFIELPCDESEPIGRLEAVKQTMRARKAASEPQAADAILDVLERSPRPLQVVAARMLAGPRAFNLVVSNIPGPPAPLYMLGCPLEEVYPVVPIAEGHPLSVGFTTVQGEGFFGVHADAGALPAAGRLARDIGVSVDELLGIARRVAGERSARPLRFAAAGNGAQSRVARDEAETRAAELDVAAAGLAPVVATPA